MPAVLPSATRVGAPAPPGVKVLAVQPLSAAARLGIVPGDTLIAINGHPVGDIIDYWFHGAGARLRVEWFDATAGLVRSKLVRKAFDERLGLELEPFEIRRCNNYCVFCFVHQLPKGLRRELYIKDEDYRLSFLYGNYITGTNLSPADKARIKEQKLSPLYFSVHATDQQVRERLLAKRNIEPIIPLLRDLTDAGIFIHAQVVLCPGINDGKVLEQTALDLAGLYPRLESVAIVPVGLTDHRERLPELQPVTPEYARTFLTQCKRLQRRIQNIHGFPVVFPSDEFFLIAGLEPPSYKQYPEIPQLANGVGMVYRLYRELDGLLAALPARLNRPRRVAAITTPLGLKVLARLRDAVCARVRGLQWDLLPMEISLFGSGITVSGLLPGADFARAMREHPGYDRYLVPENSLRPWDKRFLDDMLLSDLVASAPAEVAVGGETAESILEAVFGDPVAAGNPVAPY